MVADREMGKISRKEFLGLWITVFLYRPKFQNKVKYSLESQIIDQNESNDR